MKKEGFATMYLVYSFFLVFIIIMLSVMTINGYKKNLLNVLKKDIKNEIEAYHLEENKGYIKSDS